MALAHSLNSRCWLKQASTSRVGSSAGLGSSAGKASRQWGSRPRALVQPRCSSGATRPIRAMGLSKLVSHWRRAGSCKGRDLSSCSRK
ncbi:hypothetical protein D3C73_1435780 [compost metagenome]